jgi:hypothetical protein
VAQALLTNASANQRADDLVATHHDVATRAGQTYNTIYFTSPSIPGVEMSAAKKYVVVTAQGHAGSVWEHFSLKLKLLVTTFSLRRIVTRILLVSATNDLRSATTTTQLPKCPGARCAAICSLNLNHDITKSVGLVLSSNFLNPTPDLHRHNSVRVHQMPIHGISRC